MTRIGRYQIVPNNFTGNASYRRDNLAPLKISRQPLSNQSKANARLAAFSECIPEWHLVHKAFFEIAVAAQTKLKER
jgi:hypothetical protein